jgi:hypothetical protein
VTTKIGGWSGSIQRVVTEKLFLRADAEFLFP